MLYQLVNTPELESFRPHFTVISPQGRLPERYTRLEAISFDATNLRSLAASDSPTAGEILAAVQADIDLAKRQHKSLSRYLPAISAGVGALVNRMSAEEKHSFVNYAGIEIGGCSGEPDTNTPTRPRRSSTTKHCTFGLVTTAT
ncbi:MAG: hypothetical protein R2706_07445 [Acidimicrobiales bacterium]